MTAKQAALQQPLQSNGPTNNEITTIMEETIPPWSVPRCYNLDQLAVAVKLMWKHFRYLHHNPARGDKKVTQCLGV
jgi:hypothetical protein